MSYVFAPPAVTALPIRGSSALFPVRRVYCVGRNYAEHAIEMGARPEQGAAVLLPEEPRQPRRRRATSPIRPATKDVHHEIELVVALAKGGENIPVEQGARPRLRLRRRPRHDAPRPAGRGEEDGPALGDRQGLRGIRARAARSCRRREIGHPARGRDLAEGERRDGAEGRPEPADLEGAGGDLLPLRPVPAGARRRHHDRHAGRRRRGASAATSSMAMSTASATSRSRWSESLERSVRLSPASLHRRGRMLDMICRRCRRSGDPAPDAGRSPTAGCAG